MVEVPSNPLVVVRIEVGERSGAQVGTAVRRLQCVAASNSHIPEHYPSRCLFLPLDVESTWNEIPSDNGRHQSSSRLRGRKTAFVTYNLQKKIFPLCFCVASVETLVL